MTTRPAKGARRAPDLVKRHFVATRPNALWVTDLTYVPTWAGVAYACFIVDAFSRMIVGFRVASDRPVAKRCGHLPAHLLFGDATVTCSARIHRLSSATQRV